MRKIMSLLIGALVVVFILFSVFFILQKFDRETTTTTTSPTMLTTTTAIIYENPRLIESIDKDIEIVSENSGLIFEDLPAGYVKSSINFEYVNIYETAENFYPWDGDGAYYLEGYPSGVNREGVVSLHPYSTTRPSYLEQNTTLGDDDYVVAATIADIAGYIVNYTINCECSDVIFKIKIVDLDNQVEEKIYEDEINAEEGWQTIYLDISDYKNKRISFRIEGHAGGVCDEWCAEWAAVDEFYVGQLV